jgi:hypothetical protein
VENPQAARGEKNPQAARGENPQAARGENPQHLLANDRFADVVRALQADWATRC